MRVDVLVVGAGYAGLTAALYVNSTNRDTRVLIVESQKRPGGNSIWSAGQIAAVNTRYQREEQLEDSYELMKQDMLKAGRHMNHPELLDVLVNSSTEIIEWLEQDIGIEFRSRVIHLGGHSIPRTLSTTNCSGRDIIQPLLERCEQIPNIELWTNCRVIDMVEGIVSVLVNNEARTTIEYDQGLILCSGGYSADAQFRSVHQPTYGTSVSTTNQPGATSDILRLAMQNFNAMPIHLSQIQLGPWTSPDEPGFGVAPLFCLGAGFPYGILVDPKTSQRFCNELTNRYDRSQAVLQKGHPVICLIDSQAKRHSLVKDIERFSSVIHQHDTLEELALHYAMKVRTLRLTIQEYNRGVKMGKDAFGKYFREDVKPIELPPFFAVRIWPKVHYTCGGLLINEKAQVLDINGEVIPKLFAAGEVTGGIHGADRLGSCSSTDCLVFGKIAGEQAVHRRG